LLIKSPGLPATPSSKKPSRRFLLLLTAPVLGGFLLLFVYHGHTREFWKTLTGLSTLTALGALGLIVVQVAFQSLRLWAIIPRQIPISVATVLNAYTVGEFTNIWAPGRPGDALKVVLMKRGHVDPNVNLARLTGALLADKVVDVATFGIFCVITGVLAAGTKTNLLARPVAITCATAVLLLLLIVRFGRPSWAARLRLTMRDVLQGLSGLKSPRQVLGTIALGVTAWGAELLALRVLCIGLGFSLPLLGLLLALVTLNTGIFIPVSVANIGIYEAALAFGLSRSGIPLPAATAIATAHHALQLGATTLAAAGSSIMLHTFGSSQVPTPAPNSPCVSNTPSAR
jgi:uncharacterized membrane protein YbhN (UPF0104 family)